jgi:hypothetical protein
VLALRITEAISLGALIYVVPLSPPFALTS